MLLRTKYLLQTCLSERARSRLTVLPPHNSAYRHAQEASQCFLAELALSTNSAQVKDLCFLSHHGRRLHRVMTLVKTEFMTKGLERSNASSGA